MSLWQIFTSEYRISTRLILDIQNFFKKIIFGFEFECHSGRFSHLNIEYPPDWYWILNIEYPPDWYWIFKISLKNHFWLWIWMSIWQIFTSEYRISTRLILDIEYRISTRLILDIKNFFKKSFLALNLNVTLQDFHIWISKIQIDIEYWISNIHQIDIGYSKFL